MPDLIARDGVPVRYEIHGSDGDRPPALLIHGFASTSYINWVRPKIVGHLVGAGRRVVTVDVRGHGDSGKPHDPSAYEPGLLVGDVSAVIERLGAARVDLVGYSMGAMLALRVVSSDDRVRSVVAGGIGSRQLGPRDAPDGLPAALEVDDPASITDRRLRWYRDFVELTGADRFALAALRRAGMPRLDARDLSRVDVPVLVLAGDDDDIIGSPGDLAAVLSRARVEIVGGKHLNVINNPAFARAVSRFLDDVDQGLAG